jgi:hypothetical protein
LNDELPSLILNAITTFIYEELTAVLGDINKVIYPYIIDKPPIISIPKYNQSRLMNFTNNPLIALLDYTFNTLIGTDGPLSLKSIANHYSNGTGIINMTELDGFNITISTRSPYPPVNITIGITDVLLNGM